jgi:hypothetical protein
MRAAFVPGRNQSRMKAGKKKADANDEEISVRHGFAFSHTACRVSRFTHRNLDR